MRDGVRQEARGKYRDDAKRHLVPHNDLARMVQGASDGSSKGARGEINATKHLLKVDPVFYIRDFRQCRDFILSSHQQPLQVIASMCYFGLVHCKI